MRLKPQEVLRSLLRHLMFFLAVILPAPSSAAAADTVSIPRPGEELLAFDPQMITDLSAAAERWRLVAHRWHTGSELFRIAEFKAEPPSIRTCIAGRGFTRVLDGLHSLRVVRTLSADETTRVRDGVRYTIRLQLTAANSVEIGPWIFFLPEHPKTSVLAQSDEFPSLVELALKRQVFDLLSEGCSGIGTAPR
jgi:hypothetical protein